MAGIYVHIPFCKQACHYCNFHFSTSMKLKNGFLEALLNEILLQKKYLNDEVVDTIYLGGGTPSLLSEADLYHIINAIYKNFAVAADPEITFEANPDDITLEGLNSWRKNKINRLSIGVQSFFEEDLRWMNRAHTALQAEHSIRLAQDAGLDNITIDLIFGTPTLTDANWQINVQKAISLAIPHLSCYALTVEQRTPLDAMIRKQTVQGVSQDDQARQFLFLIDWLEAVGYEQYEISNYALPGHRSRHNSSYWEGKKYLGLGPSAHSFNGNARQWNVSNNALYIQSHQKNIVPFGVEVLTPTQKLNEWIMTSLRTKEGLRLDPAMADRRVIETLEGKSRRFQDEKLLLQYENALVLTRKGKLYADGIAAELFFDENEVRNDVYAACP